MMEVSKRFLKLRLSIKIGVLRGEIMTKCDFCTSYDPTKRGCYWREHQFSRESYCQKAIERMVEVLKSCDDKKTKEVNKYEK